MPATLHSLPATSATTRSNDLVSLIRAEYLEMPGLSVTVAQAARLWNVDRYTSADALDALTKEGFLRRTRDVFIRMD